MIAIKSIKEALGLFVKNKTLWTLAFILAIAYTLLTKISNPFQWLSSLLLYLYLLFLDLTLINAVGNLYSEGNINIERIQVSFKRYFLRVSALPFVYVSFTFLFMCVALVWAGMLPEEPNGISFYTTMVIGFFFLYLLPYSFSARFVILRDVKILKSIFETFKLYWGRVFDTIVLAFGIGIIYLGIMAINIYLPFTLLGYSSEQKLTMQLIGEISNTPVGFILSLILTPFSTLWASSTLTVYFKKVEELGGFD